MLSNISEPGPGFEYFLNTHYQDWDAIQYHEAWKDSNLGLDKAVVTRSFCKQIQKIKENGTEEEKKNAIHLENQFKLRTTSPLLAIATHGTTSSHGYGLRLDCSQPIESRKMGRIDNFWLRSLPGLKGNNIKENEKINAENIFLSCNLSCDGVQFAGTGNMIQGHKQPYKIYEQSDVEEPPSRLRKRNHSINYAESLSREETDSDNKEKSKRMSNTCPILVTAKLND
ncbi:29108_t:CDS:2 [Gigaspora margarita]|uniref:29108_t:CDS:1 n=1 Tax=Gigaspora margarita TaxID=4874 RepID=A0ABN7X2W6_GIGMA|nr:29108_t:CDS:2 [Gigaspora margarita]